MANPYTVDSMPKVGDTVVVGGDTELTVTRVSCTEAHAPRQLKGPVRRLSIQITATDAPGDDDDFRSPDIY